MLTKLGVVAEELAERLSILCVQGSSESIDVLTSLTECRHSTTPD
jgi:hypothetical protein